ncbi:hypothetical protein [Lysinibacillus sp. SGAir0095]|uniref:hypothetical protein n=1 Tax=Lysinibacillus sp. SGAir0095 TaxID=2070463 RepID=UPI0010CCD72F|nr:hypothetical protein [Lysinibacillus sp. SGAir0095]QCR30948.1 hypothetical protein C1N55_01650 [Lysinibacillus sp. SGAir0095]
MNRKLRLAWIIPNVFCYLMAFGLTFFVISNLKGLEEIHRLSIYFVMLFLLLSVSLFGSYRIWTWIKKGKM